MMTSVRGLDPLNEALKAMAECKYPPAPRSLPSYLRSFIGYKTDLGNPG